MPRVAAAGVATREGMLVVTNAIRPKHAVPYQIIAQR